jgi:lipopolysaccharide export system protein LptC
MVAPVGDMTMANGSWLRGEGQQGVYISPTGQLDLQGNVVLYRDDGVTLQTDTATLDTKSGAASSADRVHVEGPFGTLDAQGFTVLDQGGVVQFTGPARLVINGSSK